MDCPRCKLPLSTDKYEGVNVDVCRECWGYWLDKGEFGRITASREYSFSEQERREILARSKARPPRADPPIGCPKCGQPMEKVTFDVQAPITIDRCPRDGVWLDTHELKLAQVLSEDAAAVRNLFLRKLSE